jgi:hypothetical protein
MRSIATKAVVSSGEMTREKNGNSSTSLSFFEVELGET